jgi:uncharacterized protein (DUF58 family)
VSGGARLLSLRPGPRFFGVLIGWALLAVLASVFPPLMTAWVGSGVALLLILLVDAIAISRIATPTIERRASESMALAQRCDIALRVHNPASLRAARAIEAELFDEHPDDAEVGGLPARVVVAPEGWTEASYAFRPLRRGHQRFGSVQLLLCSPWRLWRQFRTAGEAMNVRVYPNFAAVTKYALLATDHRLSQLGIRQARRRGEGLEFHQLREYRSGDNLRQIDWKATSRQHKLVSREYQDERDQQVFFVIDCGRRMAACDGEVSHFDMCLNAVLLLAYVALRQGDAVGLITFSGEPRFLPPRKGMSTLNLLLDTVFDLQPTLQTADYLRAATVVAERLRKRSLVVLVTNLRDEDGEELMVAQELLRRQHLLLLANMQETSLQAMLQRQIDSMDDALAVAAAHHYMGERRRAHAAARARGALSLDVTPNAFSAELVNRYLAIKRNALL